MSQFYYQDPQAPTPTNLHVGTAVAVWHDGRLLMDHRADGMWGLVGGALELGESVAECAKREVFEETGLSPDVLQLVGVFSHPSRIIDRAGQVVQSLTMCFSTHSASARVRLSTESRELKFVTRDEMQLLRIVPTHSMILPHLFKAESWPVIA